MDAGLAKIMNSSVGSSALKALDTILKTDNTTIANNAADRIFNNLKNSTKLVGSDDVLFTYSGEWTRLKASESAWYGDSFDGYETTSYIQFNTSGTVSLKTTQTNGRDDGTSDFKYRVYDSAGNVLVNKRIYDIASSSTVEFTIDINVTSGTKYKFAIVAESGASASTNLNVCGKTILFGPTITTSTT